LFSVLPSSRLSIKPPEQAGVTVALGVLVKDGVIVGLTVWVQFGVALGVIPLVPMPVKKM
jgi:hypothetical protein